MLHIDNSRPDQDAVMAFLLRERALAVSHREWAHRLRGYGYDASQRDDGTVVIRHLLQGTDICTLPN